MNRAAVQICQIRSKYNFLKTFSNRRMEMEVRRKLEEEEQRKKDEEERIKREKEEADRQLQVNKIVNCG